MVRHRVPVLELDTQWLNSRRFSASCGGPSEVVDPLTHSGPTIYRSLPSVTSPSYMKPRTSPEQSTLGPAASQPTGCLKYAFWGGPEARRCATLVSSNLVVWQSR